VQTETEIEFMKQKAVELKGEFSVFIKNPSKYLFDGKMEHVEEFQKMYDSYWKGDSNEHLEDLLENHFKSGKLNHFFADVKNNLIASIVKLKKSKKWSKKLKSLFRELEEKFEEEEGDLNEEQVQNLVLEKLFDDWMNETSPVMNELNSMIGEDVKISMMQKVKESKNPKMIFPEIEYALNGIKVFKSMKYNSDFELFYQMYLENQKSKSEIEQSKSEIKQFESEIEQLKSEIEQFESKGEDNNSENSD
jgi:hypothetical protein